MGECRPGEDQAFCIPRGCSGAEGSTPAQTSWVSGPCPPAGFPEAQPGGENHEEKQAAASPSDTLTTYKQRAYLMRLTMPSLQSGRVREGS